MNDNHVLHREKKAGFTLEVRPDPDAENPRKAWDHLATMACKHPRYELGDDGGLDDLRFAVEQSRGFRRAWADLDTVEMIVTALPHCADILALPLSIYDHSGVTMWAGPPRCAFDPGGWDTSQVGFIFMTRDEILKNWERPKGAGLTPALADHAYALMRAEVETFDAYLTGQICGYVVTAPQGDPLDSCWGYYVEQDAIDDGRSVLDYHAAKTLARASIDAALAQEGAFEPR